MMSGTGPTVVIKKKKKDDRNALKLTKKEKKTTTEEEEKGFEEGAQGLWEKSLGSNQVKGPSRR